MGDYGIYMAVPQGARKELTWYPKVRPAKYLAAKKKKADKSGNHLPLSKLGIAGNLHDPFNAF